ncbi:pseudoazurin [Aliamphritea spongicola]|uniref:pseudoazurin n=1 Tax=Aliamphritea spongicola TaxID=707589 RepID=UPI00196A4C9B|nr:pseudoazurin [Aliamphritea spongicola]MBN3561469.1 pseudoazurin [Aliamphritea spongicola]
MKTRIFSALLLSALTVTPAYAAEYEVKMLNANEEGNMVFEPSVLQVEVGDTVTFIPSDPVHDSISVLTPAGANSWHGKRDQKISVVINKEGVYIYKCAPHYYYGMVGVIHAGNPVNLAEAQQAAKDISSKFLMNKDRLINYVDQLK